MKTLLNKIGMLKTASVVATVVASTLGTICHADNPIIQTKFTADPAPMVYSNTWDYEVVLAATHPGDAEFKPAVQQAHMFVPARNKQGAEQHIAFPEITDQKVGTKSLKLNATSDAGVPVNYFVREGPAEVEGDVLKFTPMPPRAKFPVKITVVALAIWTEYRTEIENCRAGRTHFLL